MYPVDDGKFKDDSLDDLCERFGEFLFSAPADRILDPPVKKAASIPKRRKSAVQTNTSNAGLGVLHEREESDGLTNTAREQL